MSVFGPQALIFLGLVHTPFSLGTQGLALLVPSALATTTELLLP